MKKVYLAFISLFIIGASVGFASCSDDDNDDKTIPYEKLPTKSQQFITDHFDGFKIGIIKEKASSYDVSLTSATSSQQNPGYEVEFDRNGEWVEMEGHNESALPSNILALLPRSIVSYVAQKYPEKGINEIKKETYGYKIELTGNPDIELMFDTQGAYLGEDNNNQEQIITLKDLPETAQTFVSTHFNELTPSKVKKDNDSYDVDFTNKLELEFDLTGVWKGIDGNGNVIPQSALNLLPASLTNYIKENYSAKRIEEIKYKVSSYEVELEGDIDLVFDKEGNLWGSGNNENQSGNGERIEFSALPTAIQSILTTHLGGTSSFLYAEKDKDKYEVKLKNGTDIDFAPNGELKSIEVLPGNSVPDALIPATILSYVKQNYPNKEIEELGKKVLGYKVELSGYPEVELLFDADGNFKGIDR